MLCPQVLAMTSPDEGRGDEFYEEGDHSRSPDGCQAHVHLTIAKSGLTCATGPAATAYARMQLRTRYHDHEFKIRRPYTYAMI